MTKRRSNKQSGLPFGQIILIASAFTFHIDPGCGELLIQNRLPKVGSNLVNCHKTSAAMDKTVSYW